MIEFVRVSAMPYCLVLLNPLPLRSKKMPNPNLSYPLIVEDYKHHLRAFPDSYLSFQAFCLPYKVRVESVRQWMRRRGLDLSVLYYEILLERSCADPSFVIPQTFGGQRHSSSAAADVADVEKCQCPSSCEVSVSPEILKGVSITFSDGVIVNIRQASATALTKFIESYNKLSGQNYVQSE